jgi:hypothetical protein
VPPGFFVPAFGRSVYKNARNGKISGGRSAAVVTSQQYWHQMRRDDEPQACPSHPGTSVARPNLARDTLIGYGYLGIIWIAAYAGTGPVGVRRDQYDISEPGATKP